MTQGWWIISSTYHQFANPLKLFEQVQAFEKLAPFLSKNEIAQRYEELDAIRCEATTFAEKRCRKLRLGQVAFSPELNMSRLKIQAWLLLIAKTKKRKVSSRFLKRSIKKANLQLEARSLPEEDLKDRLKEEYKTYYQIKGEAVELRMTSLDNLATALVEKGETDKEKVIQAIRQRDNNVEPQKKLSICKGN